MRMPGRQCKRCGSSDTYLGTSTTYVRKDGSRGTSAQNVCRECARRKSSAKWAARMAARGPLARMPRKPTTTERIRAERLARLSAQGGRCALCSVELPAAAANMDHDHDCCPSGSGCPTCWRAVLCAGCNTMLGHAQDSAVLLLRAVEYVTTGTTFADAMPIRSAPQPVARARGGNGADRGGVSLSATVVDEHPRLF